MWVTARRWGSPHRAVLLNLDTVSEIDLMPGNSPPAYRVHFKRDEARDPLDIIPDADLDRALLKLSDWSKIG